MNRDIKSRITSFTKNYEISRQTQKMIQDGFRILKELAGSKELAGMDYTKASRFLKANIVKYPSFELFGLVQRDGLRKAISLDYTEEEVYASFAHRPYFKEAIQGNDYQSEPYISVDTNNYCIALAVPVQDDDGDNIGVLVGDLVVG